jgi:hypothetical protein
MKSFTLASTLALGCLAAVPASADEIWSLPSGNQIVYERDVGDVAVLSYRPEQGLGKGLIFVIGLGGKYEGRDSFKAYWTEDDDAGAACPVALTDREGHTWHRWGLATIRFRRPSFPSSVEISRGECLRAPAGEIRARPVVGAGVR